MKQEPRKRPLPSLQEEPELSHDLAEDAEAERRPTSAPEMAADPLAIPLRKLEQWLREVQLERAPAGLPERVMQRIRQALKDDLANLPADVHEALIQAYIVVWLSTVPLLISASWALSKAEQSDGESLTQITEQVSEILRSMTSSYRDLLTERDESAKRVLADELQQLQEMSLKLIPLTVLNILGETMQELLPDPQRKGEVHHIPWTATE
ncbi:MAG: hypothetical protein OXF22_07670 [Anaerolineaceae bacterium]|nr:hypothetical protein [Anaerolineaceae bacterium]